MLLPRVVTALVLLGILLPTIFVLPPLSWGLVTLAFLSIAAWEWTRLVSDARRAWLAAAVLGVAGLAALAWRSVHPWPREGVLAACLLLTLFWLVVAPRRLRQRSARRGGGALAAVLLLGCWMALLELRILGPLPLLSSMAVIWVADIAAYFVGRAFGRHKLAPAISPGKSWEGAVGGFAAVALLGLATASLPELDGALPSMLAGELGRVAVAPALVLIAALSIVGDLYESLLKREAGVKDSGWILPGHGGVLDRIDSLIPTMPLALALFEVLR